MHSGQSWKRLESRVSDSKSNSARDVEQRLELYKVGVPVGEQVALVIFSKVDS